MWTITPDDTYARPGFRVSYNKYGTKCKGPIRLVQITHNPVGVEKVDAAQALINLNKNTKGGIPIPGYNDTISNFPNHDISYNYVDAPKWDGGSASWDFESCAICMENASEGVIDCVRFKFSHDTLDKVGTITVEGGNHNPKTDRWISVGVLPGDLWNRALNNWRNDAGK